MENLELLNTIVFSLAGLLRHSLDITPATVTIFHPC